MNTVRWLFLLLYLALVVGLGILAIWPNYDDGFMVIFAVGVVSQIMFICGAGSRDLWRPIRRPRLILPVSAAALMMSVLATGLAFALFEVLRADPSWNNYAPWSWLTLNWLIWFSILFVYTRKLTRYQTIYNLSKLLFAGSLAELLASVPSHFIVERRGGCFAGLGTLISIFAGLCVMCWSFGPGILLLFIDRMAKDQRRIRPSPGPSVGEHDERTQFRIRTLMFFTVAVGVIAGLGRTSWGIEIGQRYF